MTRFSGPKLLQEIIESLVSNFGEDRVKAALNKTLSRHDAPNKPLNRNLPRDKSDNREANYSFIGKELDDLLEADPEKHHLVFPFYEALKSRRILPDALDIRHFSQLIGIKRISGKSRKDLIAPLVRFLIGLPTGDLAAHIERATSVSESQRQQGFSVLTDKLLGS